jgi:hypothetical protein
MVNEVKTKVPSSPLPYYVYGEKVFSIPASTWQVVKTGTFPSGVDWSNIFIKAIYQNFNQSAPCEVNINPRNPTTFQISIRENRGVGTNGALRIMVLLDRPATLTIS